MSTQAGVLPELQIGVETPWPMKREGKQVYARLIDFGGLPLQLRVKSHNVPNIEWKQISWDHSYLAKSGDSQKLYLGLISTPANYGGSMPWRFQVDSTAVKVNMLGSTDYQEWDTVVLCLLYTKTSEGDASGSLIVPGPDGQVLTSREGELVWEEQAEDPYSDMRIKAAAHVNADGTLVRGRNIVSVVRDSEGDYTIVTDPIIGPSAPLSVASARVQGVVASTSYTQINETKLKLRYAVTGEPANSGFFIIFLNFDDVITHTI